MGPRGGGGGFGFLHMIGGLIGMALFFAVLLGLAALVYKIAVKKGWVKRHHRGPHGHRPEPGGPRSTTPATRCAFSTSGWPAARSRSTTIRLGATP